MIDKPNIIALSEKVLWASIVIGVLKLAVHPIIWKLPSESMVIALAIAILVLAFIAFMIYKIGKGKNWARWLFVILLVVGSWSFISQIGVETRYSNILPALSSIQVALQVIGACMLFGKGSTRFFN